MKKSLNNDLKFLDSLQEDLIHENLEEERDVEEHKSAQIAFYSVSLAEVAIHNGLASTVSSFINIFIIIILTNFFLAYEN